MRIEIQEIDVGTVNGWYTDDGVDVEKVYTEVRVPQIPLLLATLNEKAVVVFSSILHREGWREVGWYPSCHDALAIGTKITLYCKEQAVDCIPKVVAMPAFNEYVPLGCSCNSMKRRSRLSFMVDEHCTLGLHRRPIVKLAKLKTFGSWRMFAQTQVASYWFWGLAPDETDRFKYEKN